MVLEMLVVMVLVRKEQVVEVVLVDLVPMEILLTKMLVQVVWVFNYHLHLEILLPLLDSLQIVLNTLLVAAEAAVAEVLDQLLILVVEVELQ
jgi:hypothetical protein|tara:strand:+ start:61 stop:336 length:276 start_codon:yes stop_codon:yes gene_type:complete